MFPWRCRCLSLWCVFVFTSSTLCVSPSQSKYWPWSSMTASSFLSSWNCWRSWRIYWRSSLCSMNRELTQWDHTRPRVGVAEDPKPLPGLSLSLSLPHVSPPRLLSSSSNPEADTWWEEDNHDNSCDDFFVLGKSDTLFITHLIDHNHTQLKCVWQSLELSGQSEEHHGSRLHGIGAASVILSAHESCNAEPTNNSRWALKY